MRMASRALVLALCLMPTTVVAQSGSPAAATPPPVSNLWIVAGGTFTAVRGSCQTCEEDYPYRKTGGMLGNIGYRFNDRVDAGAEIFWVPSEDEAGDSVRTTHVDAVAQFRPWRSSGFFVKAGAGMAFVRNWPDIPTAINSKALSVVIGAGWAFRPANKIGVQVFGSQHAAALGDFQTSTTEVGDVIGNFWSFGIGLVIR